METKESKLTYKEINFYRRIFVLKIGNFPDSTINYLTIKKIINILVSLILCVVITVGSSTSALSKKTQTKKYAETEVNYQKQKNSNLKNRDSNLVPTPKAREALGKNNKKDLKYASILSEAKENRGQMRPQMRLVNKDSLQKKQREELKDLTVNQSVISKVRDKNLRLISSIKSRRQEVAPVKVEMVVDLTNNRILHKHNTHKSFHPASLTKMITVAMAFDHFKTGKISPNDYITVPEYATFAPKSKIYLKSGEKIRAIDAVMATIVSSANDAAESLAFSLVGSREKISDAMTSAAKKIGMKDTRFANASGLHHDLQKTTAKDMLILAKYLKSNHPNYYKLFSQVSYELNGKTYNGHNKVTENYKGAEGMKTGFTCKSGYNLVTVASRDGITLAGVIAGSHSAKARDQRMIELLDASFKKVSRNPAKIVVSGSYAR